LVIGLELTICIQMLAARYGPPVQAFVLNGPFDRRFEMKDEIQFSEEAASNAIDAMRVHYAERVLALSGTSIREVHELNMLAQCLSVQVEGNQVCVNLPLGIGRVCVPIPVSIPNGEVGSACLSICSIFGIPTGARLVVRIGGVDVVRQSFGRC